MLTSNRVRLGANPTSSSSARFLHLHHYNNEWTIQEVHMLVRSLRHDVPVCREKRIMRAFDVAISSALLLITLPVIAFTAILVCLESPGPVFERQRRIGKSGRPFALLRFRTLSIAPEPHGATERPARYTRVGAVIHRLCIDELPQLLNVLRGGHELRGTATERRQFTQRYTGAQKAGTPPHTETVPTGSPQHVTLASTRRRSAL